MAKFEASHMISNGFDQSEKEMINAEMSSFLSLYQAIRHPSLKVKGTLLGNKLVKSLTILIKSLINLRLNTACPKKDRIFFTHLGMESLAMISIFAFSTSIPFLEIHDARQFHVLL